MSNGLHTKGLLGPVVESGSFTLGIDWPESDERHECGSDHHFCEVMSGDPDELRANAERIRACWNACDGIPTYQLFGHEDEPNNLGEMIDHLRKQRDELVAALGDVLDAVGALNGNTTHKAYELEGYGIKPERAQEIVTLLTRIKEQA
jgi:hypothetical protein